MNKFKLSISAASKALLNVFLVCALVVLAGLIGVGGAALWIYGRSDTFQSAAKKSSPRLKAEVASEQTRRFPMLTPVQADSDTPAQLTPAHYVPTDSEIAMLSGAPRYTNISYNGGRQQAHLRVNTVLTDFAPAPLADASNDEIAAVQTGSRPPLTDSASRYITDANGRVIGVDGTVSAAQEARQQEVPVARAFPVQLRAGNPEVRIAYPVITRKALPVDANEVGAPDAPSAFDARAELLQEDERPVLRAQPVTRVTHAPKSTVFGASDDFRPFGRN